MPRYFIDSNDDDHFVRDEEGEEMDGPRSARTAALRALPDMTRDKLPDGDRRTFAVTVRNEAGEAIYKATLTLVGEWTVAGERCLA